MVEVVSTNANHSRFARYTLTAVLIAIYKMIMQPFA